MAQPTIVQTVGTATSVATPPSVLPSFATTVAGNLLVAVVAVAATGITPTVGTPASWTTGPSLTNTTLGLFTFYFPNNPGGLTGTTFGLTNTNGAAATMWEISGMQLAPGIDLNIFSAIASSTTVGAVTGNSIVNDELAIGASAWISAATLTQALTPAASVWTAATQQTSTTGATNVILQAYSGKPGVFRPIGIGGTLSGAQVNVSGLLSFLSTSSSQAGYVLAGGVTGLWMPGAYSGSIGGQ